tara:strand:- start:1142 stop:1777 length:636 start_codon:yes stop_codon:yes gene_type:complete
MPVLKNYLGNKTEQNFKLYFWNIIESEKDLWEGLKFNSMLKEKIKEKKSLDHRKGILSIRQLLKESNISNQNQYYDDIGRPFLNDGRYISFSHSKKVSGIVISDKEIGIDIEKNQSKILNISQKFLNTKEKKFLKKKDVSQITNIWTAKEAVFKAFKVNGIIFSEQIVIEPFEKNSTEGLARVFFKNQIFKFQLFFFKIRNYSCTVALSLQ